ncbi:MAG: LPS export ABC transporter periplasmic protein LptC [Candidatus Eremiobacteraeota bacterium]|nr:LPS export ABC transporter periplasmic protein LptC [Candidatus Eremiobacteraeota bacterium]MBV8353855.1 LPS export ABC transporter periplasmic protein LptC [Candidatus Eremiobacteraeota bacterium]
MPSGLETETPTPQPVAPIKARSEGTQGEPARYLVRNAKGRTIYDVRSQQALYDRSPDGSAVATFSNPDVTFHDRANRTMLATASQAIAHDKDKTVVMTGHVRATSGSEVLTCDELTYDGQRDALRGTGNVVLVNSKTHDVVTGGAISSDLSFEHVVLSSK